MSKEEAIVKILKVLNSRLMVMSPAKQEALTLAREYCISAGELINEWEKIAMRI